MIHPLFNYVIIKPEKPKEVTDGGVFLPDVAQEKPQTGKVINVGPGHYEFGNFIPTYVKKDDLVLYHKMAGNTWETKEGNYLIIKETELFAILKEEKNNG